MEITNFLIFSLLGCTFLLTVAILLILYRVGKVDKWTMNLSEDTYDLKRDFYDQQKRVEQALSSKMENVEKTLDQILERMQDVNLRVTVVETRMEERVPALSMSPRPRRIRQAPRRRGNSSE